MRSSFRPGILLLILIGGAAALADQSLRLYFQLVEGEPGTTLAQRATDADLRGEDSVPLWQEARRQAPRSAAIGVNTALALERAGRKADAEAVLLDTERVNRVWLPRWSLASFYLRNQRPGDAIRWGRLALERSHAGVRPALFALLEQAGVPSEEWLGWCGKNPEMLASALEYYGEVGKPAGLAGATRLLAALGPGRAPSFWRDSLKTACSRLILAGDGEAAAEAWNALVARGALAFSPIDRRNLIGNPGFAEPVDGEAFNWRFQPLRGVGRRFDARAGTMRILFDGSQPESSELVATNVWLEARRQHRFSCLYRTRGLGSPATGPMWRVSGRATSPLASEAGDPLSPWRLVRLEIPPSPAGAIASLALALNRKAGFTRADGEIEIREPRLEVVE